MNELNRERENTLARLSRLAGYQSVEQQTTPSVENHQIKGRPVGAMSIDAAMGTLWGQAIATQIGEKQDEKSESINNQLEGYKTVIEEAKQSGKLADDNEVKELKAVKVKNDEKSWESYINNRMEMIGKRKTTKIYPFDVLDQNRSDVFLLYSYDKRGFHSTLGASTNRSTSGFTNQI